MPGIVKIQGLVNLLSCRKRGNDRLCKKMVFKIVEIVRISEQKISKRRTGSRNSGQGSEARLAGNAEVKRSTGDVGLRVVVAPYFELQSQVILVTPAQHRQARRKVVLRVAIPDKALALGAHDVI